MRSRKKAFYQRKTVIVATALCLLSALGLAGIYRLESNKDRQDQELVNWEEISDTRQAKGGKTSSEAGKDEDTQQMDKNQASERPGGMTAEPSPVPMAGAEPTGFMQEAESAEAAYSQEGEQILAEADSPEEEAAEASVQNAINLNFRPETGMLWPVEGNVILDYSMDQSIYFPTLDQYKYNPAIAIQSEAGTQVLSAAAGVISSIEKKDETGLTMTVDLGNGYQAVYGQLANVALGTGSYIEAGSPIAEVAEPSIYYQIEGDNLYFQVLKDGQPVDPLDYMK